MYVELKNVTKTFGSFKASDNVSFGIEKGSLTALLGPSGSGKTTILNMIAGLEVPDSGDILIDGARMNDVPASKRGIGFVFQNYALFRYMTVEENIAFGLKVKKADKAKIRNRVSELIELTGLTGMEKRYPDQLSGGQRQRVAFARALAPEPALLLLDEPFAAIDAKIRVELRHWLREMIHKVGITSVFVTHDQAEAVEVADEIVITNHGRIEQMGEPMAIYKNPQTSFVATFIGQSQTIRDYKMFSGFEEGTMPEAIIRPEFVEAFKSDNRKFKDIIEFSEEGVIRDISFQGDHMEVTLEVKGMELVTHRSLERRHIDIGEKMRVIIYRVYESDGTVTRLLKNKNLIGHEIVTF